jgi:hypothetical protein
MPEQDKFTATFSYRNDTKRCYRFQEIDGEKIETLYAKKSNFSRQPKKIRVTVEVIE